MSDERRTVWSGAAATWLAILVCCGIGALAWYGYHATAEWQRSSALVVERRSQEAADLMTTALIRDMRGVQTTILTSQEESRHVFRPPYEINDLVAAAFARYPYPECFFGWGGQQVPVVFARTDRLPRWLPQNQQSDLYPVRAVANPAALAALRRRVELDVNLRRRYSIFEIDIDRTPYQVIALLSYQDVTREELASVFGFMVNLDWARDRYFPDIAQQVSQLTGTTSGIVFSLWDEHKHRVAGSSPGGSVDLAATRSFPILFFDPVLTAIDPPDDLSQRAWTISTSAAGDPTYALATRGARRSLIVVAAAVITLAIGLLITARAARATAALASVRADFVSTVTHELKTPLSTIRAIGETLVRGRVKTDQDLRKYARLLVQEERRLTRLVNNLLAYARVTDVTEIYSFEPQQPASLIAEALQGFRRQLSESEFHVEVNAPSDLPPVRADRIAIVLALDNLIDNAIRYSGDTHWVSISARAVARRVEFQILDKGVGIPSDELAQVQRRFVRGRSARGNGNGLGLAIVNRVAADHGGEFAISSEPGVGTQAVLSIPVGA